MVFDSTNRVPFSEPESELLTCNSILIENTSLDFKRDRLNLYGEFRMKNEIRSTKPHSDKEKVTDSSLMRGFGNYVEHYLQKIVKKASESKMLPFQVALERADNDTLNFFHEIGGEIMEHIADINERRISDNDGSVHVYRIERNNQFMLLLVWIAAKYIKASDDRQKVKLALAMAIDNSLELEKLYLEHFKAPASFIFERTKIHTKQASLSFMKSRVIDLTTRYTYFKSEVEGYNKATLLVDHSK